MKSSRLIKWLFIAVVAIGISYAAIASDSTSESDQSGETENSCHGKFPNPIADICWSCIFPIKIGRTTINYSSSGGGKQVDNRDPAPPLLCTCPAPPPIFIRPGIGVSFWEPVRLAEIVKKPMCSPTLNGTVLRSVPAPEGTHSSSGNSRQHKAFYHAHWVVYPVLSWLGMVLCQSGDTFDMAYVTELDPLWDDDELTFILNPEAILFANPIAQAACAADTVSAATTKFGLDSLFWCSGSTGSVYPLTGNLINHIGGVDASLNITHRMTFKLHRQFLAQDTSTPSAMCGPVPQPIMRKNQYKQQMMFPIPQTNVGLGFGVPSMGWASGREFPYKGEDFSYLIWRKRTCCAF